MSSPTRIVLSSMREHGVRYLLMGGQACIVYGAAEFSRDTDIAILAEPDNLRRLQTALTALETRMIAIPPFEPQYLARGHAVHFECGLGSAAPSMRIDVMASMRNVPAFAECRERRSTIAFDDLGEFELLRELRTPALLVDCVARAQAAPSEIAGVLTEVAARRSATAVAAQGGSEQNIGTALAAEEARERAADVEYWRPRIQELETLRHAMRLAPRT